MRLLVVDDEAPARDLLRVICMEHDVTVVGEAETGEAAIVLADRLRPDLVLMDVAMPGMGGMAAAQEIARLPHPPAIAFTTAFVSHALAAFDVGAVDYLLKPIVDARFVVMLGRARAARATTDTTPVDDHIWVPVRSEPKRISLGTIERITAERDYVRIEIDGRSHLLRATMDEIAAKLGSLPFLRIHRSTIVRRDLVTGLRHEGSGVWSAVMANGAPARIGRSYLDPTRSALSGIA
ncbi:DNA-binding response regulator [Polymorphobacter multimanifer]|uniref:Two-component system response regulator AlgR n=1 Tax=Polymorphobacter multimanifer TaxID=1070431 RepID=A0A841L2M8_9SPHN|nr:LytTR family DNA-binding domain-containing protein [Polymorphobacter multimanifer]MBB6226907.1 two-component system response regulator AlgR [Polymorphobacter multimanifer]GGI88304.1 DNA-binding response regulator [Polymorphobacter multimanifer]